MSGIENLRTEIMIVRQNQKGLGMKLKKLKENQTNIAALIKDIQRSSFKIKDGPYEARPFQEFKDSIRTYLMP